MENKTASNKMFISSFFITLKDHKNFFLNNPIARLLNPAKNEPGRISKVTLDKINLNLRNTTKVNHWKNTNDIISWQQNIKNKQNCNFVRLDVKDFNPLLLRNFIKMFQLC